MKRWLIRSLALVFVLACSVVWVRSFYIGTDIYYATQLKRADLCSQRGKLYLSYIWSDQIGSIFTTKSPMGIDEYTLDKSITFTDGLYDHHFLDFTFGFGPEDFGTTISYFVVPFWFLDSAAILISLFVWRKTRAPNPAIAFPVEIKKIAG